MAADKDAPRTDDIPTVVERIDASIGTGPAPQASASAFALFDVIGRGGMGIVYRGEQTELGRAVAFKRLLDGSDAVLRRRFIREAKLTAQLDHPNVVPVHAIDIRSAPGAIGYAMKLIEGTTLRALIEEAIAAVDDARVLPDSHALVARLEIFVKVCDAIAYAHAKKVLHRDLKPTNVMLGRFGEVYVMDWGIAGFIGERECDDGSDTEEAPKSKPGDLTRNGDVLGSASYMSPEQAGGRHRSLDGRSDEYSLGLILFELVSLKRAINASSFGAALELAAAGEKDPLEAQDPGEVIAAELRAIVAKATAFEPGARYTGVTELADDVRRFLRGEPVLALPENAFAKLLRAMAKYRRASFGTLIAALLAAVVAVAYAEVRKTSAALEARERTDRRTALSIEVATQAHRIDTQLKQMEEGLEGLTTAASWALDGPEPTEPPALYFTDDFADPQRRPTDFTGQTSYRWPVSIDFPVVAVAPGVDRQTLLPKLRKLAPLNSHMRSMFVRAKTNDRGTVSSVDERDIVLQRRGPIDYAYVDLAEGAHFVYPGMDALVPQYDARTSGFYLMSDHLHGKHWGAPYVDATTDKRGDDLVLPCTEGIWSRDGSFLGVAGVELTVTKLVQTALLLRRVTIRTSLVDGTGHEVIDSGEAEKRFHANGKDESLILSEFDIPEVVSAVREGKEGLIDVRRGGVDEVVVFVRLDALDWYYVVEFDSAAGR